MKMMIGFATASAFAAKFATDPTGTMALITTAVAPVSRLFLLLVNFTTTTLASGFNS
jgi:hypothetical protein